MNPVLLLFLSFSVLISIGAPISVSLGLSSLVVMVLDPNIPMWIAIQRSYNAVDNFVLLAIPFFILSGSIMNEGGITQRLIKLAMALVGHIKGGLAHVTVVVGMIFAGISGSSTAEAAALSTVFIPPMWERGYRKNFAVAITACASSLGVIIPPSILVVIYAAVASISVGALLIAQALPGILMGLSLIVFSYGIALVYNYPKESERWLGLRALLEGLKEAILPAGVPIIIVGGIVGGVFTATEAAVIATAYALLITMGVYRSLRFERLVKIFAEAGHLTAVILFCVATASIFGWLLAFYRVPDQLTRWFLHYSSSPTVFVLLVIVLFSALGTFMDAVPAIIVFTPMILPIGKALGVHPIHLGAIVVMTMAMGLLTLPYGLCVLIACAISKFPVSKVLGVLYFLMIPIFIIILLSAFFPEIVLIVPRLLVPKWV
ncbi:MAG TPA: TRAP transporter large permease [Candidatus Baltobacteraceae bacterium]|nr:TRAP transporter large permease [Candidatus Baltobacteraceae bacterium]